MNHRFIYGTSYQQTYLSIKILYSDQILLAQYKIIQNKNLKQRIVDAFLNLDDPEILKTMNAEKFLPSKDEDYDCIRELIQSIDFDISEL